MLNAIRWAVYRLIDGNIDDFHKLAFDGAGSNVTVVPVRAVTYGVGHVTNVLLDDGTMYEITVRKVGR